MLKESDFVKIRVAVPVDSAASVRRALGLAGAGIQGNYEYCSVSIRQTGRFKPKLGARPAIGQIDETEEVEEKLIEVICHKDLVEKNHRHG